MADASPVGLGAVLTQLRGSEWRVNGYASRRLSDVEWRYSQTEKEALALVWACERFNKVVYRPDKTNIADALSRLNCGFQSNDGEDYDFVHAVFENNVPCALTPAEIAKASAEDMDPNLIKECVQTGDWSQCNVPAYLHVKNELCTYSQPLLRGSRLAIP